MYECAVAENAFTKENKGKLNLGSLCVCVSLQIIVSTERLKAISRHQIEIL